MGPFPVEEAFLIHRIRDDSERNQLCIRYQDTQLFLYFTYAVLRNLLGQQMSGCGNIQEAGVVPLMLTAQLEVNG
ncbi:hypothetical protein D3C74_451100 [compost metagenome]